MSGGRWSDLEHQRFLQGLEACGRGEWRAISESFVPTRSPEQVRIHAQKYLQKQEKTRGKAQGKKPAIKEGHWTDEEHELFLQAVRVHGRSWKKLSEILKTRTNEQIRTHAQKYFAKLEELRTWGYQGDYKMDGTRHLTKCFMSEQLYKTDVPTEASGMVEAPSVHRRMKRSSRRDTASVASSEDEDEDPLSLDVGTPSPPTSGDERPAPYTTRSGRVVARPEDDDQLYLQEEDEPEAEVQYEEVRVQYGGPWRGGPQAAVLVQGGGYAAEADDDSDDDEYVVDEYVGRNWRFEDTRKRLLNAADGAAAPRPTKAFRRADSERSIAAALQALQHASPFPSRASSAGTVALSECEDSKQVGLSLEEDEELKSLESNEGGADGEPCAALLASLRTVKVQLA